MTVTTRPNLVIFMPDQLRYDAALHARFPRIPHGRRQEQSSGTVTRS